MITALIRRFDCLGYVKKCRELGMSEGLAELHAREFEKIFDTIISIQRKEINDNYLVVEKRIELTKKDIEPTKKRLILTNTQLILLLVGALLFNCSILYFLK